MNYKYQYAQQDWISIRCHVCNRLLIEVAYHSPAKLRRKCDRCKNYIVIACDGDTYTTEIECKNNSKIL